MDPPRTGSPQPQSIIHTTQSDTFTNKGTTLLNSLVIMILILTKNRADMERLEPVLEEFSADLNAVLRVEVGSAYTTIQLEPHLL